jgi:hypothetical protein
MPHKFAVGDNVYFRPTVLPIDMARGPSVVTMLLPDIDGSFGYRIKNPKETHERIAKGKRIARRLRRSHTGTSCAILPLSLRRQDRTTGFPASPH